MSKNATQNWKNNEEILCKLYSDYGIPVIWEAKDGRKTSKSVYDCRILLESPVEFCNDAKYTSGGLAHHTTLEYIETKYCKKGHQKPVMFSRTKGKHWGSFTIKDRIFMGLLAYWFGTKTREEVLASWGIKNG